MYFICCFGEAKRKMVTVDQRVYYTFCHDIVLRAVRCHSDEVMYICVYKCT